MVDENGDEAAVFGGREEADRYIETTPDESVGDDAFLAIIEAAARIRSWSVRLTSIAPNTNAGVTVTLNLHT